MLLAGVPDRRPGDPGRLVRVGAARRAGRGRRRRRARRRASAPTTTTPTRSGSCSGIARRQGGGGTTDVPGIIFLEIDGLALPGAPAGDARRQRARAGALDRSRAPTALVEWETDLSSQTGASQAGILLGSNDDIPAFRWVEKETGQADDLLGAGRLRRDRAPPRDRAAACWPTAARSRGNLLSGEADEVILTVSRMQAEKQANPGYRALLRQRLQRHPRAGAVRLGGRARVVGGAARHPPRRAPARPPRRHLPAHAGRRSASSCAT